jgi:hypothetical protein
VIVLAAGEIDKANQWQKLLMDWKLAGFRIFFFIAFLVFSQDFVRLIISFGISHLLEHVDMLGRILWACEYASLAA